MYSNDRLERQYYDNNKSNDHEHVESLSIKKVDKNIAIKENTKNEFRSIS